MKIIHTDAIFYWKFVNDLFEQITILFYRVVQPVSSSRIHQQLQNNVGGYKNMGSGINESCASKQFDRRYFLLWGQLDQYSNLLFRVVFMLSNIRINAFKRHSRQTPVTGFSLPRMSHSISNGIKY